MCGICLMMILQLNNNDHNTLNDMLNYYKSYEDVDFKHNNNTEPKEEVNSITSSSIDMESSFLSKQFKEIIALINNRGPDYLSVNSLDMKTNELSQLDTDTISTYKDVISYMNTKKKMILIDSVLSLRGDKEITKQPIAYDKNILQYNGEIYSTKGKEMLKGKDLFKDNDSEILYDILTTLSTKIKNDDIKEIDKYGEMYISTMNQIESDHAYVYHDIINNKIVVTRDIFGKRSLVLVYIKSLSFLMLTSTLPQSIYDIKDIDDIMIIEIPNNSVIVIDITNIDKHIHYITNKSLQFPSMLRFDSNNHSMISNEDELIAQCDNCLKKAVSKRVNNMKSTITSLAVMFSGGIDSLMLAYYAILVSDKNIIIDLLNISFDKEKAPDRKSGLIGYRELLSLFPERTINLILIDKTYDTDITPSFESQMKSLIYPRSTHMDFNISSALKLTTKLSGYKVDKDKFLSYYSNTVNNTQLDDVYKKNYNNNILSKQLNDIQYDSFIDTSSLYKSKAKIVLSGLGADELMGGYSRYRNGDIEQSMKKDIDRIWMRNFGRDDRACSDNGIELRFPFFDVEFIDFLKGISDIKKITDFTLGRGIGEKKLLRNVAKSKGFHMGYMFEKRAIQFGTKLAHETNIKKYGSNNKANGKAQFK